MTIYSWNVNGIRAAHKKGFMDWFTQANGDIVCVQETKARKEQLPDDLAEPEGYYSFWASAKKPGYSGVALYSRLKPLEVEALGVREFDDEGRTLIAFFDNFAVASCYFPNSQQEGARLDYKLAYCAALKARIDELVSKGINVVISGDYNIAHKPIDLARPEANENNPGYLPEEREWMSFFLDSGYTDTFRMFTNEGGHYTWWSYRARAREKDIGWRIDYHCVNSAFSSRVRESVILKDVMGSDHCPIKLIIDV
ncbi:exodeoxyribonuclease III [Spirochaetia bacterium 38H-sp]|uniref:Exodeoxyribonuclease III n=1 Tax=Rarispira pelagica TaxID=3141764 RepID=A0ABU9UDT3_9SPIR